MNLPPLDIPGIMRQFGLHTDKRLGQNFLIDDKALRKVVEVAGIQPSDAVLEIGAGLGNLTGYLAAAAREVVTVEIDDRIEVIQFGNQKLGKLFMRNWEDLEGRFINISRVGEGYAARYIVKVLE